MDNFLPYTRQTIDQDDIAAVTDVLRSDYLTSGPRVAEFEDRLAGILGSPHIVACSSGTAALHLAALGLELGPSDKVIVPAVTFVATANGPRFTGAEIVFADVDPETGLMERAHLQEAIDRTSGEVAAVFPVHLGGQTCDMPEIRELATQYGFRVVEDACHALGTVSAEGHVTGDCAFSDISTFSFHPAKTIAMGEGGVVAMRDDALARRVRDFCNHGIVREPERYLMREDAAPGYYEHQMLGYNYRASDLHCALGISQLNKLDRFVAHREKLVGLYDSLLKDFSPLLRPVRRKQGRRTGWHLYQVLINFDDAGVSREALMRKLRDRGIGTQVHYIPVPSQPYYGRLTETPRLPGADAFYRRCLSLPLYAGMTEDDVSRVCDVLQGQLPV